MRANEPPSWTDVRRLGVTGSGVGVGLACAATLGVDVGTAFIGVGEGTRGGCGCGDAVRAMDETITEGSAIVPRAGTALAIALRASVAMSSVATSARFT